MKSVKYRESLENLSLAYRTPIKTELGFGERRAVIAWAARADYQQQVRPITHAHERVLLNLFLFRQNLHNEGGKKPGNR